MLVRLRLGLLEQDIAYRFGVSQSTVSHIFSTWINFFYLQFRQMSLWPPREYVQVHMPTLFKEKYPTMRVIIDTTEIFISHPFQLYPSSISDKELTRQSGLQGLLDRGDSIMADRGSCTSLSEVQHSSFPSRQLEQSELVETSITKDPRLAMYGVDQEFSYF